MLSPEFGVVLDSPPPPGSNTWMLSSMAFSLIATFAPGYHWAQALSSILHSDIDTSTRPLVKLLSQKIEGIFQVLLLSFFLSELFTLKFLGNAEVSFCLSISVP